MTERKRFPVRFTAKGMQATEWFAWGTAIEAIEARAERIARITGAECDIEFGAVMPSGKATGFERVGIRVQP